MTKPAPIDMEYGKLPDWEAAYAEHCPEHTCPASRHTRLITEMLRDPKHPVRQWLYEHGWEPDHWASSMEATVLALWQERSKRRDDE